MSVHYLLVQRSLQVQGVVRHEEATGRLHHWLGPRNLWSILHLPDDQSNRVPAVPHTGLPIYGIYQDLYLQTTEHS